MITRVPKKRLFRVFCEEVSTTETQSSQRSENFLTKNSLLCVLRVSALKTLADPSFGGSAVQSPSPASGKPEVPKKNSLSRLGRGQGEGNPIQLHLDTLPSETVSQCEKSHECHSEPQVKNRSFTAYEGEIPRLSPRDDIATQFLRIGKREGDYHRGRLV